MIDCIRLINAQTKNLQVALKIPKNYWSGKIKVKSRIPTNDWFSKIKVVSRIPTNDWFSMITSHIVPLDPVLVKVVQNGQATFVTILQNSLSIVRLSFSQCSCWSPLTKWTRVREWIGNCYSENLTTINLRGKRHSSMVSGTCFCIQKVPGSKFIGSFLRIVL